MLPNPNSEETETLQNTADLVNEKLPPNFARLYSQHSRLRAQQAGLPTWRNEEATNRLNDALEIISIGFLKKEHNINGWNFDFKRAGELLEWLSHPELSLDDVPTLLLAAGIYQIAGYPARSSGLLSQYQQSPQESNVLYSLLKTDFQGLLNFAMKYWNTSIESGSHEKNQENERSIDNFIINETIRSLGILCAEMRWGNQQRIDLARTKLLNISKSLLYGETTYSWLTAKLVYEVVNIFSERNIRKHVAQLQETVDEVGRDVFEKYCRLAYLDRKALIWPSQIRGVQRLLEENSFALFTPTGSGKTTIAELAIIQSLFRKQSVETELNSKSPIVIYMVPSRALASEVENRLSRTVRQTKSENVLIITGLYGGTDWGPTDAWLSTNEKTVLICTYEKTEALIRFLSPLFLDRVTLAIIDEAHSVKFDKNLENLIIGESRALRVESLGMRLLQHLSKGSFYRTIALSAVAGDIDKPLSNWITGQEQTEPERVIYRSTRQLIGRLMCHKDRRFTIFYDIMDGSSLELNRPQIAQQPQRLYIPNPFPQFPETPKTAKLKPAKLLRLYLLWAALWLASPDDQGQQHSLLISITQGLDDFSQDFLEILDKEWSKEKLPIIFIEPTELHRKEIWNDCLLACEDYFGTSSTEYQLLKKGIIIHHGSMPGLLARKFVEVIHERIIFFVLATSTLSEGVNLPFETILIPRLDRRGTRISVQEFENLSGRAGRPGSGTEGRTLVILPDEDFLIDKNPALKYIQEAQKIESNARENYHVLASRITNKSQNTNLENKVDSSPLGSLLTFIEGEWKNISNQQDENSFYDWLEKTAPIEINQNGSTTNDASNQLINALDTLDGVLLPTLVEEENHQQRELTNEEVESYLIRIWQQSFTKYASEWEARLSLIFINRGKAITQNIYSDKAYRRKLYCTGLSPQNANDLIQAFENIKSQLALGVDYGIWSVEERYNFIQLIAESVSSISKFNFGPSKKDVLWQETLRWWLNPNTAIKKPAGKDCAEWFSSVSKNFIYKFNWGLGSIIALAVNEMHKGELSELILSDWPKTGLPWIVFWIKELITWGTLDPVAAFLLARGMETTRSKAELMAVNYYSMLDNDIEPNEIFNATIIRKWAETANRNLNPLVSMLPPEEINVEPLRDFTTTNFESFRVIPTVVKDQIHWIDPAGFPLCVSDKPNNWLDNFTDRFDFSFDVTKGKVFTKNYL